MNTNSQNDANQALNQQSRPQPPKEVLGFVEALRKAFPPGTGVHAMPMSEFVRLQTEGKDPFQEALRVADAELPDPKALFKSKEQVTEAMEVMRSDLGDAEWNLAVARKKLFKETKRLLRAHQELAWPLTKHNFRSLLTIVGRDNGVVDAINDVLSSEDRVAMVQRCIAEMMTHKDYVDDQAVARRQRFFTLKAELEALAQEISEDSPATPRPPSVAEARAARAFRVIRSDRASIQDLKVGTTVYPAPNDFGVADENTSSTGVEHMGVSLEEKGYPFFTIPFEDLVALPKEGS